MTAMGEFAKRYIEDRRPVVYHVRPKLFHFPGKKWFVREHDHTLLATIVLKPLRLKEELVLCDTSGQVLLHAAASKILETNVTFTIKNGSDKTLLKAKRHFLRSTTLHTKWSLTFADGQTGELLETNRSHGFFRRINPFYKLIQPARYKIIKKDSVIAEIKRRQLFSYSQLEIALPKIAGSLTNPAFMLIALLDITDY